MTDEALKLTIYSGERERANGRFLADALTDSFARHHLRTSVVLRGMLGFGAHQRIRTDRLLTLSEDLPVVSVAVDAPARVEAALADVQELRFQGLVTLERARLVTGALTGARVADGRDEATKLTVYLGRQERVGGAPAFRAVVDVLRRAGVAGATVLLGVDGTAHGVRRRARFFGANSAVPLMVIAVGRGETVARALPALAAMLSQPLVTLERVRVCKRDGHTLAEPRPTPAADPHGMALWQKLMIYSGEQARHDGHPLHETLIRALRERGAAGATCLRGIWGYHGDHRPHGDVFWQIRRRVPVVTVVIDTPERIRDWYAVVDACTEATGLVTSEIVPAYRATAPRRTSGGLRLADRV